MPQNFGGIKLGTKKCSISETLHARLSDPSIIIAFGFILRNWPSSV
jgi:hypothetical protein